ncbi:MAG: nicotinate-nucleotide adenylyltransferase [Bacteroidales bacterium]|nr:nicotinate-nucleotide adenylyltransferase [Bacteroidales bacterium]
MKIGLFFGSFNPVHIGHMVIANYLLEYSDIDQIWFVLSPQNPLKEKSTLLPDYQRLELLNLAISDHYKMKSSTIEFSMPKPSYTIDTLTYLKEKFSSHDFSLIMGADNLATIHKWKNYEIILSDYKIIVYPRHGKYENEFFNHPNVKLVQAPLMEISSSFIREAIKDGKDIRYFLPYKVNEYINEMYFYKK